MKKFFLFVGMILILLSLLSCEEKVPGVDPDTDYGYVNSWIYENMGIYYLWNNKIPSNPDYTQAPDIFFESLLNRYDEKKNRDGDRFSWIQKNYVDLLESLKGVSNDEIGFEYVRVNVSPEAALIQQYYLLVLYPKLDTDAYAKGVKRGHFVMRINGQDITDRNFQTLISGSGPKSLTLANRVYNEKSQQYEFELDATVTVNKHVKYAESPVYFDQVYTINDKKIGYLVYNFFSTDEGDKSNAYDRLLMAVLKRIQSEGANELVLDLRYNSGGAVSSATALASALVKNRSIQAILATIEYNAIVNAAYEKEFGKDHDKEYFIDKIENAQKGAIDIPALNLPRLYVLVSRWTASASEFVINGLKPYMDVILIGETTVGKNVGSITLYEKDNPKNKWGLQPIILKFYNSQGMSDFTSGFTPDYPLSELDNLQLVEFGSRDDILLNKALQLISGVSLPRSSSAAAVDTGMDMEVVKGSESIREYGLYDDVRQNALMEIMKR